MILILTINSSQILEFLPFHDYLLYTKYKYAQIQRNLCYLKLIFCEFSTFKYTYNYVTIKQTIYINIKICFRYRTLSLAIVSSMSIITLVYILSNMAYFTMMTPSEIATEPATALVGRPILFNIF